MNLIAQMRRLRDEAGSPTTIMLPYRLFIRYFREFPRMMGCQFIPGSAYIFNPLSGCQALLGALYLFSSYALRWQSAFRNLIAYLGIGLLTNPFESRCCSRWLVQNLMNILMTCANCFSGVRHSIIRIYDFVCNGVYLRNLSTLLFILM